MGLFRFLMSFMFVLSMFAVLPAYAETSKPGDSEKAAKEMEKKGGKELVNPYIKQIDTKARALSKVLSEQEAKDLGLVRENFGVLRSIDVARDTIQIAVKKCSEANKGLSKDISQRFEAWDGAISPAMKNQKAALKRSVSDDIFSKDADPVQDYLDTIDQAAKYSEEKIDDHVVTSEKACKSLMESMDETQDFMLKMIEDLKWPVAADASEK